MKAKTVIIGAGLAAVAAGLTRFPVHTAWADCGGVTTSVINCGDDENGIGAILGIAINILNGLVIALAVLGVVITGLQYITAGDNAAQVNTAKRRLLNVVIGIAVYLLFYGILLWLLPGGVDSGASESSTPETSETENGGDSSGGGGFTRPPSEEI